MDGTIDDTLRYVLLVTRHIKRGCVRSAILAVLMDLGFSESLDGLTFVRLAIFFRFENMLLRFNTIYTMVAEQFGLGPDSNLIEQAIRGSIEGARKNGSEEKWLLVCPPETEGEKHPSNGRFISRFACLLQLWQDCREEEAERVG